MTRLFILNFRNKTISYKDGGKECSGCSKPSNYLDFRYIYRNTEHYNPVKVYTQKH